MVRTVNDFTDHLRELLYQCDMLVGIQRQTRSESVARQLFAKKR